MFELLVYKKENMRYKIMVIVQKLF